MSNQKNQTCLICGNRKNFTKIHLLKKKLNLKQCSHCSFIFQDKIKENLKEHYQESKEYQNNFKIKKIAKLKLAKKRFQKIKKYLKQNDEILDIGTNEGSFIEICLKNKYQCQGIEPNTHMAEYAKSKNLPIEQNTIEELNTKKSFNFITLFTVLEHITNPDQAIKKIYQLLMPNGFLILEVPNIESYTAKKLGTRWPLFHNEHLYYFSPITLQKILKKHNFIVKKILITNPSPIISISECLFRLGLKKKKSHIDITKKEKPQSLTSPTDNFLKKIVRTILNYLIIVFQRGDTLTIIAQKK